MGPGIGIELERFNVELGRVIHRAILTLGPGANIELWRLLN